MSPLLKQNKDIKIAYFELILMKIIILHQTSLKRNTGILLFWKIIQYFD
jgi:hypothetical protein